MRLIIGPILNWAIALAILLECSVNLRAAVPSVAIREALKLAAEKSGRELAEASGRQAAESVLERSVARFGDVALRAAADGGLELIEAAAKHGDDVMKLAVEVSPAARRVFALETEALLPLARRIGPEALELEAKAPGKAAKVLQVFGDDAGKVIAKSVPAEDLPRLLTYAEKADSPATRKLLLTAYQKEGKSLFERIPAKLVLAGGVTATMLYGTHRGTQPLQGNPNLFAQVAKHLGNLLIVLLGVLAFLVLWRFRLLPWHAKAPEKMATAKVAASNPPPQPRSPSSPPS